MRRKFAPMNKLGISANELKLFLILFLFNLTVSIVSQYNAPVSDGLYKIANLLFPVWITILGGTFIGIIIFIFQKSEQEFSSRLLLAKFRGMFYTTCLLSFFYV